MGQHKTEQPLNLDGLFGHLSASSGLYSRETFINLYSCIVRLIRQYHLKGLVYHRVLDDPEFLTVTKALENLHGISSYGVTDEEIQRSSSLHHESSGFFIVLTNQLCATVYWSTQSQSAYSMYDGGWAFHPGDSKIIALEIAELLNNKEEHIERINETPLDRRYDEKTTGLITQLINNLENRNRELTFALNQVQQLNAKMLDQERLAAIGQLCSVIAHEIRNPLGLIDLYAKLIESQIAKLEVPKTTENLEGKAPLEKNLQLIRSATQNLESILSELTSYARPLELNLQALDLRDLVIEVGEMFAPKFEEKNITLHWITPPEPLFMDIDQRRIQQALINLVKNALEASKPETTVDMILDTTSADDQLFIKVQDQGSGVKPESQQKLFTPYFSTKGNGTGLGLAHSLKILQAHGGTVSLLETSENGSIFALVLPNPKQTGAKKSAIPALTSAGES